MMESKSCLGTERAPRCEKFLPIGKYKASATAILCFKSQAMKRKCPGWESNPHEEKSPEDFKSSASAIPPPGHRAESNKYRYFLYFRLLLFTRGWLTLVNRC